MGVQSLLSVSGIVADCRGTACYAAALYGRTYSQHLYAETRPICAVVCAVYACLIDEQKSSGRFLLVMLSTDELSQLARSHGIVSQPTAKVYRRGKVVDTLHGAESEDALCVFIGTQLAGTTDGLLLNALGTHAQGDTASVYAWPPKRRWSIRRTRASRSISPSRWYCGGRGLRAVSRDSQNNSTSPLDTSRS